MSEEGEREGGMRGKYDTYDDVTRLEFEWVRFCAFWAEPVAIYESTV